MKAPALLLLVFVSLGAGERQRFEGYRVYRLLPKTEEQLQALRPLESRGEHVVFLDGLQLRKMDVLVAPAYRDEFLTLLEQSNVLHQLVDGDAAATLALDIEPVADSNRRSDDYSWTQYHELNDTYQWLRNMAAQHANVASVFVAGQSYEGRELLGLRIAANGAAKQAIFLEGGMHAREWISPATASYIANELLTSRDVSMKDLARSYIWYILPHANPDGYVYTHSSNRLWRKTRSPQRNNCFGSDPNRNWGYHWREVGASPEPCSESYAGPEAFSERETETLSQFLRQLPEPIFMYVSLHSFSQLLLYPYGHTSMLPANQQQLQSIYAAAVGGMKRRFGTRYSGGNVYDAIYPAAGSSMDWAYGELGVKYAFTYELRPSAYSYWTGFRLPAAQIIATGQETSDSLVEMVKAASAFSA